MYPRPLKSQTSAVVDFVDGSASRVGLSEDGLSLIRAVGEGAARLELNDPLPRRVWGSAPCRGFYCLQGMLEVPHFMAARFQEQVIHEVWVEVTRSHNRLRMVMSIGQLPHKH